MKKFEVYYRMKNGFEDMIIELGTTTTEVRNRLSRTMPDFEIICIYPILKDQ